MFTCAFRFEVGDLTGVGWPNMFYLPPTLVRPLEGPVLEEVVFLRDELANLAWAVERRLESPLEEGRETAKDIVSPEAAREGPRDVPLYRLASPVPAHWLPLLPVQASPGSADVRLARGAVLDLEGVPRVVRAEARLLEAGSSDRLLIHEEEVPREGVVVRRSFQAARSYDGRLFVWAGNRVSVGRREASTGLSFDTLDG